MRRIYCRYCGAKLRRDYVGLKCPTRSCQWEYGIDEEDSLNQSGAQNEDTHADSNDLHTNSTAQNKGKVIIE